MNSPALAARLADVRARVARAEAAAGRPGAVRLLLATKTQPADVVAAALDADDAYRAEHPGTAPVLVGENRVQELVAKGPTVAGRAPLHLIGPLQSNKVNATLRWAGCVESVASLDLARRLAERTEGLDVFVQVNVSGEPTKHGTPPAEAPALVRTIAALGPLRVTGLMTVGANSPDAEEIRAGYRTLRTLRDELADVGVRELSMGMSGDLELAIAEGATLVRVGSAVFGPRPT